MFSLSLIRPSLFTRTNPPPSRGLAFVTKDRRARLAATAAFLAQADYDIVCLQEIWIHKEFESMRQDVQGNYQYSRFFHT